MLEKGREWNWVFKRNRGQLDEAGGDLDLRIYRSRQPRPKDVLRFKDKGVKTILSLNGDQDKTMKHWVRVKNPRWPGRGEQRYVQEQREVNLRQFIADQGIEHHYLRMSSKRAPSEADIVAAFQILLDDSKKPILLHCTGGADRTGVIGALYRIEFMGWSKEDAKREMRRFMWGATRGTEIQGAYIDLYQPGTVRRILRQAGVPIPARYAARP
ncbi:MAG TPA: hypothetical protein DEA08_08205 [Planctomycetes bacterium]|nr:hypothetical protein [Planctomycetota bacterium]